MLGKRERRKSHSVAKLSHITKVLCLGIQSGFSTVKGGRLESPQRSSTDHGRNHGSPVTSWSPLGPVSSLTWAWQQKRTQLTQDHRGHQLMSKERDNTSRPSQQLMDPKCQFNASLNTQVDFSGNLLWYVLELATPGSINAKRRWREVLRHA